MIYIASPFFNHGQLEFVKKIENILKSNGWKFFSPRSEGVIKDMTNASKAEKNIAMHHIYKSNVKHIQDCEILLANIDDRDPGTLFEIGFAAALHKPIITITNCGHMVNVMIRECSKAHIIDIMDLPKAIDCIKENSVFLPDYLKNTNEDVT